MKKIKIQILLMCLISTSLISGMVTTDAYANEEVKIEVKEVKNEEFIPIEAWKNNKILINWVCYVTGVDDIEKVTYGDISKINYLDLNNCNDEMPEILGDFTSLTKINLSGVSKVEDALKYISNIKGVKDLNVANTKILDLSTIAKSFPGLESLDISNNPYGEIPNSVYELSNLKYLEANNCAINDIQGNISKLKELKYLRAYSNNISKLPNKLYEMQSLTYLDFQENKFTQIPVGLFNLKNLEYLNMGENKLIEIPNEIKNVKPNVKSFELNVMSNQITNLPPTDGQTIIYHNNFLPMRSSGLSAPSELRLKKEEISVQSKERISDAELENLVKVIRFPGIPWEYEDELDSRHKLEFIIDNKVVTVNELSKLPVGEYDSKVKLKSADLNNQTAVTKDILKIKVM